MPRTNFEQSFVVSADVGGTSTSVVVMDDGGLVRARVRGGGGNVRSSTGAAVDNVAAALSTAWTATHRGRAVGLGPCRPARALTVGVAGCGPAGREEAEAMVRRAVHQAGLAVEELQIVTDLEVAYAAAAPSPDGALLLAGTGAVACQLVGFRVVRRCDGLGWLLGDVGSGVWIGLAGLRAAAAALDGRGPGTGLVSAALELTSHSAHEAPDQGRHGARRGGTDDPRQELVRLVDTWAPADLGRFAPAVVTYAAAGDAVAREIVREAATGMLRSLDVVTGAGLRTRDVDVGSVEAVDRPKAEPLSVVLAGSVLTTAGPVRAAVHAELTARGWTLHLADDPVVGGLRLATHSAGWPELDLAAVGARLAAAPQLHVSA